MSKRGQLENLISLVEKGTTSDPEQSSNAKEKVKETRKQRRMTSSKRDLDQID